MFDIPKALIDAGGWTFAAAVLAAVFTLLVKGELALKREVARETDRADKATMALETQISVNREFGEDVEKLSTQVGALVTVLGSILRLPVPSGGK